MNRPNLAMDAPPTSIDVGGIAYGIDADFRVWLLIQEQMRELYSAPSTPEDTMHNLGVIAEMEALAFGGVLQDEDPYDALAGMTAFLAGYPEPPMNSTPEDKDPVCSFAYDLNYIILAIRNQGGPDLSYRHAEPFHWWEFLLEFRALSGEHYINRLMEIRGYEDPSKKDSKQANREAMRLKHRYALPYEMTADERRAAEEFDRMTGG